MPVMPCSSRRRDGVGHDRRGALDLDRHQDPLDIVGIDADARDPADRNAAIEHLTALPQPAHGAGEGDLVARQVCGRRRP